MSGKPSALAKASFPEAPIVVIGDACTRELVKTALAVGATTFIDENVATSSLIKELELVAQGEPVISVLQCRRLLTQRFTQPSDQAVASIPLGQRQLPEPAHQDEAGPKPQLSDREAAILNALAQGKRNKVIAYQLCITEATVKVHIKAIFRKIRAQNRTQAALWAAHHPQPPTHEGNDRPTKHRVPPTS